MLEVIKNKKDIVALGVLALIAVVTHFQWLFIFKYFTSGDWGYITPEKYDGLFQFSPIWFSDGLGGTSATPSFYLIRFFEGALAQLGADFMLNEKIFFLIPLSFVGLFSAYLFLRRYFSQLPAILGSLVFSFNTALLFNYAGPLTIAMVNALAPLALYSFMLLLEKPANKKLLIGNALLLTVMMAYELRITIIIGFLCAVFFLFKLATSDEKKRYISERFVTLSILTTLLIAFNMYWLLPYAIGSRSGVTFSSAFDQGLFVSFSSIVNALTLYHPFWTGQRPATFIVQQVPLYAWILPIVAFSAFAFVRNKKGTGKEIIFWLIVAIFGCFLIKQVNEPIIDAYPWIFDNVPGFAAYRESSKFYLLTALAYSVLVPYTLVNIKSALKNVSVVYSGKKFRLKRAYLVPLIAVCTVLLLNALPLINGKFQTLYIAKDKPTDYQRLDAFINSQPEYFRTVWLPISSRWAPESILHPKINTTAIVQGTWGKNLTNQKVGPAANARDKAIAILSDKSADRLLDAISAKYVIIPSRDSAQQDDFFKNYGNDRNFYIDKLDEQSYLKKIDIGTEQVVIYENFNYKSQFSTALNLQKTEHSEDLNLPNLMAVLDADNEEPNIVVGATKNKVSKDIPSTKLVDASNNIIKKDLRNQKIQSPSYVQSGSALAFNESSRQIGYRYDNGLLILYRAAYDPPQINGAEVSALRKMQETIQSIKLNKDAQHFLSVNNKTINFEKNQDTVGIIGKSSDEISIHEASSMNLIKNGSFEESLWGEKVQDCNPYDRDTSISMSVSNDKTDGKKSLSLTSLFHKACTTSSPMVVSQNAYLLQFYHKAAGTSQMEYEVRFDNGVVRKGQANSNTKWSQYKTVIDVPKGAKNMQVTLIGLPNYQLKQSAVTNFDDVQVMALKTISEIAPQQVNQYTKVDVSEARGTLTANYAPGDNQEAIKNGDFSKGLWQREVFDCNNFDDFGDIAMKSMTRDANNMYLQLSARRHTACTTNNTVTVKQGQNYLFSMQYQALKAKSASYAITFNDPYKTVVQDTIKIQNSEWQNYAKQIEAPLGATNASITLYSYGSERGSETYVNNYDDVSLRKIPIMQNQLFVINRLTENYQMPQVFESDLTQPTRKYLEVKNATTPFYLNYTATYNPLWSLQLDDTNGIKSKIPFTSVQAVPKGHQYAYNDFMNGWYVEPYELCKSSNSCNRNTDGSYDIKLVAEFAPQKWFYLGATISVCILAACVCFLLLKSKKQIILYKAGKYKIHVKESSNDKKLL